MHLRGSSRRLRGRTRGRRESGQTTIEFVGILPFLVIAVVLALQAYVTVVAFERVHNAARTAARVSSMGGDGAEEGWKALPEWLVEDADAPVCEDDQSPRTHPCVPEERCVEDGHERPWETTCVYVTETDTGLAATVRTELPLLFPGAPLVFPIEKTVEMPT